MVHPRSQYCTRSDIFELTPLDEKINFNIIGRDGGNIFKQCLMPPLRKQSRSGDEVRANERINFHSKHTTPEQLQAFYAMAEKNKNEQALLVPAVEERFFKLVEAGQKYGYDTDAIIEKPACLGSTVFETATLFSVKICKYILNRNIRVNNILVNFVYPVFSPIFGDAMWEKMLKKGINPKVISGRALILSCQTFLVLPFELVAQCYLSRPGHHGAERPGTPIFQNNSKFEFQTLI